MRIALDTNVLLAAFVARGLCADLLALLIQRQLAGTVHVFVSRQVLAEFRRHLKGKFNAAPGEIAAALAVLETFESGAAKAAIDDSAIPDPDDAPILAAAVAFGAECFVTGDKALLGLGKVADMSIVTARQMFEALAAGPRA